MSQFSNEYRRDDLRWSSRTPGIVCIVVFSARTIPSIRFRPSAVVIQRPAEPKPLQVGAHQQTVFGALMVGVGGKPSDPCELFSAIRCDERPFALVIYLHKPDEHLVRNTLLAARKRIRMSS